jgi:hypothetical protein
MRRTRQDAGAHQRAPAGVRWPTDASARAPDDAPHWRVYWRLGETYGHKLLWGADPPVDRVVSLVCS